jgi:hypothetical protein
MVSLPHNLLALLLLFSVAGSFSPVMADEGQKLENLGDSLDDQLLKDLGEDFLKDLPGKKKEPRPTDPNKPSPEKPAPDAKTAQDSTDEENPLARIGKAMRQAEGLIAKGDSSRDTQQLQDRIVTDLDKLIEEIRKRKQQQQPSSSGSSGSQRSKISQPGKPADTANRNKKPSRDSSDRVGQEDVRKVDMAAMQSLLKDLWGHLPERQREQMLQSSVEEFLPKYETMIRQYYLRLAEQARESP